MKGRQDRVEAWFMKYICEQADTPRPNHTIPILLPGVPLLN